MKIKSIVFGATGIVTAGLVLGLTQGFNTPHVTQVTGSPTPAASAITGIQTQPSPFLPSKSVTQTETNPNSGTRYHLPLSERIQYADIAAKNAVGGGYVTGLSAGTVQGQEVWNVAVSHQGQKMQVLLLQSNDSVLSTTQVG
ncbi:hypothetical protein [Alicyclobacillus sp. ALC3]|uniref:hypothetical protein n=1 Tax=Alicyclobacillus sp. ALC3 TaxID=2796143 RepID=UPI002378E2F0|nr:hypothetical protein [Alicyclobacillus sp. ALC3]WDL97587.1 hypothetical protein JC200_02325 [Alicyclobacillus sp. ALC3]